MSKGLLAKKSIGALLKESTRHSRVGFKRTLGPFNLVTMGIGAIIGAGLFVLTGKVAANFTGPGGLLLAFIIAAIIASFSALCYAEFASLIPISGSAYTYAYVTMGEFFAWIMGIALTLEYFFSFCTVAVAWSGYFNSLMNGFGVTLSLLIDQSPLVYHIQKGWISTGSVLNLPAMLVIVLIAWFSSRGIQTAALLNNLLVILKVGVIILFIGFGLAFIHRENFIPFIPENSGVMGEYGWSGILRGAGILFFAFLGFDAVSTLAQEAKNPQRDLPIGMLGSLLICALVYILFGVVLTGVVDYRSLGVTDPVSIAVAAFGPKFLWFQHVVRFAILAGLTSVMLVMLSGQARILCIISQDGLLPKVFGKTHPVYRTPVHSTLIISLLALLLAGFFPVDILGQLTSMGALFVFAMVCFGVLILRFTQPRLHRPFKVPFAPWIPLIGTLACILEMCHMPWVTWLQFISFTALGCLVYFVYGRKHSKIRSS